MEKKFTDLVNKHRGMLFKVCNLYCSNEEDKKDMFQEIILQLWKSFPRFREEAMISTWMYRVALNTAISHFRKESKKPGQASISAAEFTIPDMQRVIEDDDNISVLKQAIALLTRIEKAVIMLYLEEKNYDDISNIIGITKTNVGVMISRIKIKLEKIIKTSNHEHR